MRGPADLVRGGGRRIRRMIHRLVHPEAEGERRQIEALHKGLTRFLDQQHVRDRALAKAREVSREDLEERLRRLGDEVAAARRSAGRTHAAFKQQARVAERGSRRRSALEARLAIESALAFRLDRVSAGGAPVLLGPWCGEVGFELLYWIPFLRWASRRRGLDAERLVAVTRGGAGCWYGDVAAATVDILDLVAAETFVARTREQIKKQFTVSAFDRVLLRQARDARGLARCRVLHPSVMYRLFLQAWKEEEPLRYVDRFAAYARLPHPGPPSQPLPSEYVAVKFYFNESFPDTAENRGVVAGLLRRLTAQTTVVLLTTQVMLDDHRELSAEGLGAPPDRLVTLAPGPVARNLEAQSRIVAGAKAFVGTYGGFSYLAPFYGVPSVALYASRDRFVDRHLELSQRVFSGHGFGSLTVLETSELTLLQRLLDRV